MFDALAGLELGPYRLLSKIGEGGAAVIYRAYQPSMGRYVAIKLLKLAPEEEDPTFVARFTQEARTLAQLQHPHILPVIDFGQAEGYAYLVMVLLEQGTLRHLLRKHGALPLDTCAFMLAEIASALDRAHGRGIIHRDLKPENILLDEDQHVYLTDFGIAGLQEGARQSGSGGQLLGTPQYMAPEQARGAPADVRSDVYALGVMLYEMVLGQLPFRADSPHGLIFKHLTEPPPRPRGIDPTLPEAVERVLLRALEKDPARRYLSALDLAAAFVDALPQEPVASPRAEQRAAARPAGVTDTPGEYVALRNTPHARLEPQPTPPDQHIAITRVAGDERASIPATNAYMHYALRALEEVAGLQATQTILHNAGLDSMLDAYPPNNLRLSPRYTFQDFSNFNQAIVDFYGAAGKEAAMHIGRTYAHWMFTDQPYFGITNLALRVLPTAAALRLALNKGIEGMVRLYHDQGVPLKIDVLEKTDFFLIATPHCPCCVGKHSSAPICWIWEALLLEGAYLIKGRTFPVKQIAARSMDDPYCVWRVDKAPLVNG